jgi:hypothetical protein
LKESKEEGTSIIFNESIDNVERQNKMREDGSSYSHLIESAVSYMGGQ